TPTKPALGRVRMAARCRPALPTRSASWARPGDGSGAPGGWSRTTRWGRGCAVREVLIGYSACDLTREAFERAGVRAWTCDLLPARGDSQFHIQGDVWKVLDRPWAAAVLHPMCTYLTVSAAWA